MKRLFNLLNMIIKKRKELKRWQRIVMTLAAMITFVTTYALILPAITVERDNTEEVGGMYLEQEETQDDLLLENALEFTGFNIAADQENAVTFTYAGEDMTATAIFSTDEEIPEGSELEVNPVDPESGEYADFSSRSAGLLDKEFIYDVTTRSFYDFALVLDNVDVTPTTGLVDIQIVFRNNTVEHIDDTLFAGRFGRPAAPDDGLVAMSTGDLSQQGAAADTVDELVSVNPDESAAIELTDSIITALSLKGSDLARTESVIGILAGTVDEEAKAAASETDAEIPDYDASQEDSSLNDPAETDGEENASEVKILEASGKDYTVTLTYDETSGIPGGADLIVSEIPQDSKEYQTYLKETKKAMGLTEEETLPRFAARFFDIKIMVDNVEFKPESGVSVEITYAEPLAEKNDTEVSAVHFADKKAGAEVIEANTSEVQDDGTSTVEFTAESFSVYGVIYTVDFHYDVDGETFNYSIRGGYAISLRELLVILKVVEENAAQEFVDDIETVEFSNPELIHVAKVEEDTTVGEIKVKYGLKPEYSDNLTEQNIAEMDAKGFKAIDWALTTLKAFDTEEKLTITLADGEVFVIKVTDARDPLGIDDRTFSVVSLRAKGSGSGTYYSVKRGTKAGSNGRTFIDANVTAISDDGKYSRETDTAWLFEYDTETNSGGYFMSQYGSGQYLIMNPNTTANDDGTAVSLTDEAHKTPVYVSRHYTETYDESTNTYSYAWDGTYRISNKLLTEEFDPVTNKRTTNEDELMFLWNYGGSFWVDKVGTDETENQNALMHFCLPELDPSNDTHSGSHKATRITVQDLVPGQSVVLYRPVLQPDHSFLYYAIAEDSSADSGASMYRVWNSSDSVYWKGNPAILWKFVEDTDENGEPNGYYFFINEATGHYLAAKEDGTIVQDPENNPDLQDPTKVSKLTDHVQVALPGLNSATAYTSKIANWDYMMNVTSGPKIIDANEDGSPDSVTSVNMIDSQEFYFAVLDPIVQKQFTEVDTVDSIEKGITMTMYNFSGDENSAHDRLTFMDTIMGSSGYGVGALPAEFMGLTLAKDSTGKNIEGYPNSTNSGNYSLGHVFEGTKPSGVNSNYSVAKTENVNNLFLKSVYDSTGFFRYSSFENFAHLNTDTGKFSVYEQIGVPATDPRVDNWMGQHVSGDQDWNQYYKQRGNFMPYNEMQIASPRQNLYGPQGNTALDEDDPRKYEDLYRLEGSASDRDYFFGMIMEATFQQDYNGLNDRGDPVRYDFNGDDDLWIYIDGVKILDIGGVHDAFNGHIDFVTGQVWIDNHSDRNTTIKDCFWKAGVYPDGSAWDNTNPANYNSEKALTFFKDKTFADYSSHEFKMFYMERGAGASNLDMQFNLTILKQDQFKVTKDIPETSTGHTVQENYGNEAFYYKAYLVTSVLNAQGIYLNNKTYGEVAKYEDGKTPVVWHYPSDLSEEELEDYDPDIFEVHPGHSAIFPVVNHGVRYYVEEVEPETGAHATHMLDYYDVTNSDPETEPEQPENKQLLTDVKTVQQRSEVVYWNRPDDGLINELRITKKLHGGMITNADGTPVLSAIGIPYFEYAVYLEDNDGHMVPYELGEYYIIDSKGRYVYYQGGIRHYQYFEKTTDDDGKVIYKYYNVTPENENDDNGQTIRRGAQIGKAQTNPKITDHFGADGLVWDIRDGDTLVIVGLMEGTHYIVSERTYGDRPHVTNDPNSANYLGGKWYLYDRADVRDVHVDGEFVSVDEGAVEYLFSVPDNAQEIKESLTKPASTEIAEGDIKLDYDAEVTVHNRRTYPIDISVQKKWPSDFDTADLNEDVRVNFTIKRYRLVDKIGSVTLNGTLVNKPSGASPIYKFVKNGVVVKTVSFDTMSPDSSDQRTITINDLPVGEYQVIFSDSVKDYDATSEPSVATITVSEEEPAEVSITSTYAKQTGYFRIIKNMVGNYANDTNFSATYTVEGDELAEPIIITLPVGSFSDTDSWSYVVGPLPKGTYTVTESVSGNGQGTHTPESQTVTVVKGTSTGAMPEAVFTGQYKIPVYIYLGNSTGGGSGWSQLGATHVYQFAQGSTIEIPLKVRENGNYAPYPYIYYVSESALTPQYLADNYVVDNQVIFGIEGCTGNNANNYKYPVIEVPIPSDAQEYHVYVKSRTSNNNGLWTVELNGEPSEKEPASTTGGRSSRRLMSASAGRGLRGTGDPTISVTASNPVVVPDTLPDLGFDANYKKYVLDDSWTMTVIMNPDGTFTQSVNGADATDGTLTNWTALLRDSSIISRDPDGDLYYYFIQSVSETNVPVGTFPIFDMDANDPEKTQVAYWKSENDKNQLLSITNDITGSLKVEKHVTVNSAVATATTMPLFNYLADGEYTFDITGIEGTSAEGVTRTVTITISNGEADPVEVENLTPGRYTVTERDPHNGTALVGPNDIELTVAPSVIGDSAPTASFTNNIETTQLEVHKIWTDDDVVDHSQDYIEYKVYRIPYHMVINEQTEQLERVNFDPEEVTLQLVPIMEDFTGVLNETKSWQETVRTLPKTGSKNGINVTYEYYVVEGDFHLADPPEGEDPVKYKSIIEGGEITEGNNQGEYSYNIINEPMSSTDQEKDLEVKKKWKFADAADDNTLHKDDSIKFNVIQKKYLAKVRLNPNDPTQDKMLYPITIKLVDEGGVPGADRRNNPLSTTVYVPEGARFVMTPRYPTNNQAQHRVMGIGFTPRETPGDPYEDNVLYYTGKEFVIETVDSAKEVTLWLYDGYDTWVDLYDTENPGTAPRPQPDYRKWTCGMYSPEGIIWNLDEMLKNIIDDGEEGPANVSPTLVGTTVMEYTMSLANGEDGMSTVITNGTNAQGHGVGSDDPLWQGLIKDLIVYEYKANETNPALGGDSYIYKYEVEEVAVRTGADSEPELVDTSDPLEGWNGETSLYYAKWEKDAQPYSWTITNQRKPFIDVTIQKVDADNLDEETFIPLPGAKFKLVKYTLTSDEGDPHWVKDTTWETDGEKEIVENEQKPGVFSFENLKVGYYQIDESQIPKGYINYTEKPMFQVRINPTTHAMEAVLVHASGENIGQLIDGNATELVKIGNGPEGSTVRFGNPRGAALPHTGGHGTGIYMILGSILIAGAGLLLLRRRKTI